MLFKITIALFIITIGVNCASVKNAKNGQAEHMKKMVDAMEKFFDKYCKETDKNVLQKLEACEKTEPESMKTVERKCAAQVLKIPVEKVTYTQLIKVECDKELGDQFEKCDNNAMAEQDPKMKAIAKKIMYCGFDVYGIPHD